MSNVIYARVRSDLKAAADEYARQHDRTIASALAELIEQGLGTTSTVEDLRKQIAQLEADLSVAQTSLAAAEASISLLGQKQHTLESAYQALADRLSMRLGSCPSCQGQVTGKDLLVGGRCPSCGKGLTSLLVSKPTGLDERELLLLIGAVGLVLGIALIQAKKG